MEDIFKYNIFTRLSYIDIRNFCQSAKIIDIDGLMISNPMKFMKDDSLFEYLHSYYSITKLDLIIDPQIYKRFASYYHEIYARITTEVINRYSEIPRWVNHEIFINDVVEETVRSIEYDQKDENSSLNVMTAYMDAPFVSDNFDYNFIYNNGGGITSITMSNELLQYILNSSGYPFIIGL